MTLEPAERADGQASAGHLVNRIESGDSGAETELVGRFQRGVRLMLRRLAGNPALVDDLLQETFALVISKARSGQIQQPDRLAGFIRSTARNLLIADRRKEARYATGTSGEALEDLLQRESGAAPATSSEGESQLTRVLRDEEARLVRTLLDELRFDRDRELLIRFYLAGDDKHKLCSDLEIAPDDFRRFLFRARQRFRELWDQRQKREWIELRKTG